MKADIRECFQRRETGVFGGFSRESYIREIVKYMHDRYEKKQCAEPAAKKPEAKKSRLSSFENYTETTSINKCTMCVVVPSTGLIAEIVGRLLENRSVLGKEVKDTEYRILGDECDDFMLPLMHTENGFEEASNMQADILMTTTKALVTLGDHKIDRSKYFIAEEEGLADFSRKAKNKLSIYAFLSGVDTAVFLDADILQLQNAVSLRESVKILEEALPAPRQKLNLRYLSSGAEKKAFVFLANVITPCILELAGQMPEHRVVKKAAGSPAKKAGRARAETEIQIKWNKSVPEKRYKDHHINTLANEFERTLVIVRDSIEMKAMQEEMQSSSMLTDKSIFFIDEFTPGNKIKDELKGGVKRVWVITERFIFYRRKRLSRVITPYNPVKVFSCHMVNPRVLELALKAVDPKKTEHALYASPVILTASDEKEKYIIEELLGKEVSTDELFAYSDEVTVCPIE
ncbi:uncharacterized protein NEMAJ01_0917 [Nematocida major]|uniref:uncharacterized protein n=1 Tax=Nematocida major TaxID=1912982 RepID=UPI00200804FE|nr:uncharacterized protein NEMAJ01_0917 [Nematocida major]KAH9386021.1 hypothetical protein NEMAJ01_0917 [Nematocida major]